MEAPRFLALANEPTFTFTLLFVSLIIREYKKADLFEFGFFIVRNVASY
ncbi:hypothetical protein [Vibrio gallaecicus]|nr:hypothetical protein [Vibrio gallaecicus]MDN3613902.1 hypothetical protein [Vibrio gallaecicus]